MSSIDEIPALVIPPKFYMRPSEDRMSDEECLVFMNREGDEFAIHVGKNYVRRFTLETMPDYVKQVLAMIHAHDWNSILKGKVYPPLFFKNFFPEASIDIGWMTGPNHYALVLELALVNDLRGTEPEQRIS